MEDKRIGLTIPGAHVQEEEDGGEDLAALIKRSNAEGANAFGSLGSIFDKLQ
jgi:hypothetical protein